MYRYIIISLFAISLFKPITIFAHDSAQPHFFKINGAYLDHYPIKSTSLPDFILPQEIYSIPLLINQSATFQIEKNNIPLQNKTSSDDSFTIDFGDGQRSNGVNLEHTYGQIGSYIITLSVKPIFAQKPIIFDQALVNVVPDQSYQLPMAQIKINDTASQPETSIDFRNQVRIDGTDSKSSNQIVNYFWDLGDGNSSDLPKLEHTYANYNFGANLLLRVKDQKGFISDISVRLTDNQKPDLLLDKKNPPKTTLVIFIIGLATGLFILLYKFRKGLKFKLPY